MTSSPETITIGILSTGRMAHTHAAALRAIDEKGLAIQGKTCPVDIALYGRNKAKVDALAREYSISQAFTFQNLPPGEYGVSAERERYARSFRDGILLVKGLSSHGVDIILYRGGTILGILVDKAGQPIKTARLRIGDVFTGVSGNGRFIFHRVPRGLRHIDAFVRHYEPTRLEALYVEPNRTIRNIRIVMCPRRLYRGSWSTKKMNQSPRQE